MNLETEKNDIETEELILTEEEEVQDVESEAEQEGSEEEEGSEVVIGFSDDTEADEGDTPLVKRLRDQLRESQRRERANRREPANNADPEPTILARPRSTADFDYDEDRFNEAMDAYEASRDAHAEWKGRQADRDAQRRAVQDEQARKIEQQKNALGVSDYDARSSVVKDALTEGQLAVLINGADNPAQVIYALGRSQSRLDMLAGEQNLARFAVMLGKMEKDIKVSKKSPPAPDSPVRGATGSLTATTADKKLAALEKEAERTGDRSKIAAYRRQLRKNAA